jgi:hypothetical protein
VWLVDPMGQLDVPPLPFRATLAAAAPAIDRRLSAPPRAAAVR